MHRALLFDLDGVLVDTAKYHFLAWKALADELGIPFTREDNERLKGVSRMASLEIILELGKRECTEAEKEALCSRKNGLYVSYIRKMTPEEILPGVQEFMLDAKRQGYRIALGSASRNSATVLERVNLWSLFDAIADGTNVTKPKPDPEVFLVGAKMLGVPPEECIVFEDFHLLMDTYFHILGGVDSAALNIGNKYI